jgi:transcriptional regulator with XRE-family HTH domain
MKQKNSLPELLRELRLCRGHTQEQVAIAIGLQCKGSRNVVSRIERGKEDPTFDLLVRYLRACGATTHDLVPLLDRCLAEPLPVPELARPPRPTFEGRALLELRREARPWLLRQHCEHALHRRLTELEVPALTPLRTRAARFGRTVFRILLDTRAAPGPGSERRLGRARSGAQQSGLSPDLCARIEEAVTGLVRELEATGDLDRLPSLEDARTVLARPRRRRLTNDDKLCRNELNQAKLAELLALEARRRPILESGQRLVFESGVKAAASFPYAAFVRTLLSVCQKTAPDTPERAARLDRARSAPHLRILDQSLLSRLAAHVPAAWDAGSARPA